MSLNIKNERVHALARQAAAVTGKTQTGAIEEALERLLAEHGRDPAERQARARLDAATEVVTRWAALPDPGDQAVRTVADLYDDAGLPR